jgi:hypothetical protein
LVGANMSGTEKFPLLAIGKSDRPRCFKNKEIPLKYKSNKKAWMTAQIFEEVLRSWDEKLGQQQRRVLLVLDNCSAHPPDVDLENIHVVFFPPNTTAMSQVRIFQWVWVSVCKLLLFQPMDQGIIQNLKMHYKKLLLRRRLEAMDGGTEFKINLLDALHLVRSAWNRVNESTIKNCFAKAKFVEQVRLLFTAFMLACSFKGCLGGASGRRR